MVFTLKFKNLSQKTPFFSSFKNDIFCGNAILVLDR